MRPATFPLLRVLADGAFHSGESVGRTLGYSRASVWLAVQELEHHGVKVFKVRGRGYRLGAPVDLLDAAAVRAELARGGLPLALDILEECGSTNSVALERAAAGAPSGLAIACELQTAGRGRRGNPWLAPLTGSLSFSLLWRFERGASGLTGLSLAAGVACVRALERLGARGIALKWPNDIVCGTRKLGGILIELAGEYHGPSAAVVGIGLNVRLPDAVRGAIGQAATDLASVMPQPPSRNALLAASLAELAAVLKLFAEHGFGSLRDEWLRRHAHQGERVRLTLGDARALEGRALGVGDDGALLLERDGRVERFHSGEVSLRPAGAGIPTRPAAR